MIFIPSAIFDHDFDELHTSNNTLHPSTLHSTLPKTPKAAPRYVITAQGRLLVMRGPKLDVWLDLKAKGLAVAVSSDPPVRRTTGPAVGVNGVRRPCKRHLILCYIG